MRGRVRFIVFIVLFTFGSAHAAAQTLKGTVSGFVTDGVGAPVPGASVTLTHAATNRSRVATTDADGLFLVSLLAPGNYRLEIARDGFRTHQQWVELRLNQEVRVEVPLLPATVAERVEVVSTYELLKTNSAAISTVIENRQVTGLPLDGRNFFELSLLLPGAVPPAQGSAGSVRGDFALHVNGAREDANQFLLDGVYNGDPKLNGFGVNPPVDAILEFEVLTHNYDASFGRNAGGQVNVALKSGTNDFHGTIYHFLRNAALDARNAFAPASEPAPKFQRNQFGFSLGGPVARDRTFFFANYEGRIAREGITRITNVPTLAERSGDFSQSLLPRPRNPFTGEPFEGGVIPAVFIHPVGAAIAALYPEPNRATPGQNFVSSPALRDDEHHFDVRVDHALTPASELAARYSFADRDLFEPFAGTTFAAVPGFGNNVPRRAQNLMVSETHTFSPLLVNEFRFGFNRVSIGVLQQNAGTSLNSQVGLPELSSQARDFGLSFIRISGFSPLGHEFNNPQESTSRTYQFLDQVSYVRGSHLLKFGGEVRIVQQDGFRDVQSRGFLNFLGVFTGNPLADLLLGLPTLTGGALLDNPQQLRTESYSLFVNDTWRLGRSFAVNWGLRYEYHSPPVDTRDRANVFDPVTQMLVQVGTAGVPRSGYRSDHNNFAPRIGIAWMPFGRPGTVVRAGYGVFFDQFPLAPGEGLYFNPPFFDFRLFFSTGSFLLTLDDPFPDDFPILLPRSALAFQRDLRTPYVQHWNVTLQQKLGAQRMVEVGYVASKGTKLLAARDINQPAASPLIPNFRPLPQFDDINLVESRANSTYHSLQARFQQRHDFGLTMLISYTLGKSLDDASNFFPSAGDPNFPQDSHNVAAERARSNFDVRQRLVLSYAYDFPFGRGQRYLAGGGWAGALLGGWQTYGIVTLQTGRPFTVALLPELDNSNTGRSILGFGANDRPNLVGDPTLANPAPGLWFNPAAFALPPFGTFGNAGRNLLDGPGLRTWNVSLLKNINLREAADLQFRTEFFNVFNHPNLDLPDNFFGSPTFGQILSAQSPRRIQFALKLLF